MRAVISARLIAKILRLSRAGLKDAEVARLCDVSKSTVNEARRGRLALQRTGASPTFADAPRRCRECGGLCVDWPCRLCHVRALKARERRASS